MTAQPFDREAHRRWCLDNREAAILMALRVSPGPLNTATLSAITGLTEWQMRHPRRRLAAQGRIVYCRRRGYAIAEARA